MSGPTQLDVERAILLAAEVVDCERKGDALAAKFAYGDIARAIAEARDAERNRCAALHESVNPASNEERLRREPGFGAMGAVIEYRDLIRMQHRAAPNPAKHPADGLGEIFTSDEYNQANRE